MLGSALHTVLVIKFCNILRIVFRIGSRILKLFKFLANPLVLMQRLIIQEGFVVLLKTFLMKDPCTAIRFILGLEGIIKKSLGTVWIPSMALLLILLLISSMIRLNTICLVSLVVLIQSGLIVLLT